MEAVLNDPVTLDDAELFSRARDGDASALESLVDRYKDALVNYLTRITGSRETGEDLAQETFLRLLERSANYVEQGKLRAYLYRIATNLARSTQRRESRWRLLQPMLIHSNGHRDPGPAADVERRQLGDHLVRALHRLPARYRVPVVLRDIEDWSYADIATVLRVRPGTVKSRLHRGRALLRDLVDPVWNGERP